MSEKYYILKSEIYKFEVTIINNLEYIRIYIGNKKACIVLSIDKETYIPNLDTLEFDEEKCTLNEIKLEPSKGTILMLKTALKFLCIKFPNIKKITLTDNSFIECFTNVRVKLYDVYLAKYGLTWYESKFNVVPDIISKKKIEYYDYLNELNNILESPIVIDYNEFMEKYMIPIKVNNMKKLHSIYNTSKSWRDFITKLSNEFDCIVFDKWLSYFMVKIGRNKLEISDIQYLIERNTIDEWDVNIKIEKTTKKSYIVNKEKIHKILYGGYKRFSENLEDFKRKTI